MWENTDRNFSRSVEEVKENEKNDFYVFKLGKNGKTSEVKLGRFKVSTLQLLQELLETPL